MGDSNSTEKCVKKVKESAISGHLLKCSYLIHYNHFDILASAVNKIGLLIKESLPKKQEKPVWNHIIESIPLKLFYY